jgi:hypothetical protein
MSKNNSSEDKTDVGSKKYYCFFGGNIVKWIAGLDNLDLDEINNLIYEQENAMYMLSRSVQFYEDWKERETNYLEKIYNPSSKALKIRRNLLSIEQSTVQSTVQFTKQTTE